MYKFGWHWPFIKNGFSNEIRNSVPKIARSFFCKIIFQVTSSWMVFKIFMLRTLSQISLHMSNQWIRASSDASWLITVPNLFNTPLITMIQVWHPQKSMISTNSKLCELLTLHGMRWTWSLFIIYIHISVYSPQGQTLQWTLLCCLLEPQGPFPATTSQRHPMHCRWPNVTSSLATLQPFTGAPMCLCSIWVLSPTDLLTVFIESKSFMLST